MSDHRDDIPDAEIVYRRIHYSMIKKGSLNASAFKLKVKKDEKELSVDRASIYSAEDSKSEGRFPEHNGVVSSLVSKIKGLEYKGKFLNVKSDPRPADEAKNIEANPAHCAITGIPQKPNSDLREIASKLKAQFEPNWEIKLKTCEPLAIYEVTNFTGVISSKPQNITISSAANLERLFGMIEIFSRAGTIVLEAIDTNTSTPIVTVKNFAFARNGDVNYNRNTLEIKNCEHTTELNLNLQDDPSVKHSFWEINLVKNSFKIRTYRTKESPHEYKEPETASFECPN